MLSKMTIFFLNVHLCQQLFDHLFLIQVKLIEQNEKIENNLKIYNL
jgi:hypothetical protein